MASEFSIAFSHVGIYVTDMDRMIDFYTRFLHFVLTDRGVNQKGGAELAFLSRDPREHHQIVLIKGRPADLSFNIINQISFRVDSLPTLRQLLAGLAEAGYTKLDPVSHGNAISVYFGDPEGNRVELLIDTPWYIPQPYRIPIDLSLPDKELWAWAEAQARSMPGFRTRAEWRQELEKKIARASLPREPATAGN
jgi:catechol 2,3-dioxygenase-like lactoylglutathione lyase family enzyme